MCSDCRPACVCVPDAVPHKMRWGRRSAVAWSLERLSVWHPVSEGNGRCWDGLAEALAFVGIGGQWASTRAADLGVYLPGVLLVAA